MTKTVLVLGSARDAIGARDFDGSKFDAIVTVNNAWQIREDWTHLVHSGDFPDARKPVAASGQQVLSYEVYVPANNAFGGIVYAGGTMAFSAAYWALHELKPDILAFYGCDMIYNQPDGRSHFYGKGEPDPLRKDPTLQSLEAKANRLMLLALQENCLCTNLSELPESRLTFPKMQAEQLGSSAANYRLKKIDELEKSINSIAKSNALQLERELNCIVQSGDYWLHLDDIQGEKLAEIDQGWLNSMKIQSAKAPTFASTKQRDFA